MEPRVGKGPGVRKNTPYQEVVDYLQDEDDGTMLTRRICIQINKILKIIKHLKKKKTQTL